MQGYPAGAIERVQQIETEILQVTAQVCEQLGIEWFADSGTVIGAVRHEGFIPWDDDIDIGMRIEDYRRFCEFAPALLPEGYGLYTHAATPNYPPLWAKVHKKGTRFVDAQMQEAGLDQGIFVDVFAYSRLDSDEAKAARQMRGMIFWQRVSYLYYLAHPKIPASVPAWARPLAKAACSTANRVVRLVFSSKSIERRFDKAIASGDGGGRWVSVFYPAYGTFETEVLFPVRMALFEGLQIPVPADTHTYLTTRYGDYMQLPPEEARHTHAPLILDFGDGVNVVKAR